MSLVSRIALLFTAISLLAPAAIYARPPQSMSPEGQLFNSVNRERAAQGLSILQWDDALAIAARDHASQMALHDLMSHQLPGEPELIARATAAGVRFSVIAENVAIGPDTSTIHTAWMRSPGHRANILSPELSAVGIAVVQGTSGLFAVQDFAKSSTNLSFEQQEQQVVSLLAAHGLQANSSAEAQTICNGQRVYMGNRAATVLRFETPDLGKLPAALDQEVQSNQFHTAAVGACASPSSSGFSRFRIAVVLF
ncbi:MAG: CAP domain-containing protein [Candidatus Acidiferrales bacterium]